MSETEEAKEVKSTLKPARKDLSKKFITIALLIVVAAGAGFGGSALFELVNPNQNTTTELISIESEGDAVQNVVEKVGPSVVSIVTTGKTTVNNSYYNLFYGGGREQETSSAATGVIISKDGYIVTNKHVVPESTTSVKVVTRDGTEYENVAVVARDPMNDIAFLKIADVSDLTPAEFSDNDVKVGQKVIAIGNALGQYQNTVTAGIISGVGRTITAQTSDGQTETLTNLIQTDAAINQGNSGGPLVTYDGKIVGINTAIVEDAEGLGFAIPISEVRGVADSVLDSGKISRAYLGIYYTTLTESIASSHKLPVNEGAYLMTSDGLSAIVKGSPADKADLRTGDIIIAVDGEKITSDKSLSSITGTKKPGDKIELTVMRGDQEIKIKAELGEYE